MRDLVKLGSETAKGGFANEDAIANKFNSWKKDKEAWKWLKIMGYNLDDIEDVEAIKISGHKTDIQIKVKVTLKDAVSIQNLSIKKANHDADYNQTDKRWISRYKSVWDLPNNIVETLKKFTGEITPIDLLKRKEITKQEFDSLRSKKRFFLDELDIKERRDLVDFFKKNKIKIIADIIRGSGKFPADWMLVTKYNKPKNETSWILKDINYTMNIFGSGKIRISPRGSLYIGRITMQRKGGDAGRETGKMLQFKIKPCDLFKELI